MGIGHPWQAHGSNARFQALEPWVLWWFHGTRSFFVLLLLMLPALLGVFLFELLLDTQRKSTFENARDLFPRIATRLLESGKIENILTTAMAGEFPETVPKHLTRENIPIYVAKIRKALNLPARIYFFNNESRLVYPPEGVPDQADRELLCSVIEARRCKTPITPESIERTKKARMICKRLFGQFNLVEFEWARRFRWTCNNPPEPLKYVAYIGCRSLNTPARSPLSILHIEVYDKDIPDSMRNKALLSSIPDSLPFAGIVGSDHVSIQAQKGTPWFSQAEIPVLPTVNDVEVFSGGFFLKKPLEGGGPRFLLLAAPFPFPGNIPKSLLRILELGFLLLSALAASFLSRVVTGTRRVTAGLGRQIAVSFGFAGLIPFLALFFLGTSLILNAETLEKSRWEERMFQVLTRTDRQFQNWVDARQIDCQDLGKFLMRSNPKKLDQKTIPPHLQGAHSIVFSKLEKGNFAPKSYSTMANFTDVDKAKQGAHFEKIICDIFRQILVERGQGTSSGKNSPAPLLTIQDILGENNPGLVMVKNLDEMTLSEFNATKYLSFCQIMENLKGEITGFLLLIFDMIKESDTWYDRIQTPQMAGSTPHISSSPYIVVPYHPAYGLCAEMRFSHPEVGAAVKRTFETQISEVFSVSIASGPEYLAATYHPCFLSGQYPVCFVPMSLLSIEKERLLRTIFLLFILGFCMILGISRLLWKRIILPVHWLQTGTRQVGHGQFQHRLPVESHDELGKLSNAFNLMAQGLQERERMRRFVSHAVWRNVRDEPSEGGGVSERGRFAEAAILFSDIRNFTSHSESHPPDEIVQMLNDYFTEMDEIIRDERGEIQKLIGDAIMAVFHQVPELPHPAFRAVQCGLKMRKILKTFNALRQSRGLFEIDNGIGIDFGTVLEGKVGASSGRLDLAVMGPAVSTAQKLEGASKMGTATRVILSSDTRAFLPKEFPLTPFEGAGFLAFEVLTNP